MRRLALLSLSLLAAAPAFAAPDWVVYQRGSLAALAVDRNSVRTEKTICCALSTKSATPSSNATRS